jgi:zinc protease
MGEAAVDNPTAGEAWDIARATMESFYNDGVTEQEIGAAKDYLTGAEVTALTSTDKIAGVLVGIQLDHLGRDYLDRRNDLIRKVTPDEVGRVIRTWFDPGRLTLVMVGKPEGIKPTETVIQTRE